MPFAGAQSATFAMFALFAGLTGELYRPACSALLADLVPAGQRVTAFAAYRMAFNAGWAFGPAVAGLLAKRAFPLVVRGRCGNVGSIRVGGILCVAGGLARDPRDRGAG